MKVEFAKPITPIEGIDTLNKRLKDYFGVFDTGEANWKIFWSEDMVEQRLCDRTDNGIILLTPEARTVRKASYIRNRYVLCHLVPIPEVNRREMLGAKTSYEPIWTFEDEVNRQPYAPEWGMIHTLINTIYNNIANADHKAPYTAPEIMNNTEEARIARVEKLMEAMYGNETKVGDALSLDTAVGYGPRKRKDWLN